MITFHFSTYPADGAAKVYEDDSWWLHSETEDTDGIGAYRVHAVRPLGVRLVNGYRQGVE